VSKSPLARFGDRVRKHRKKRGLSQEQLGFDAGVHRTFVGAVERGEVNISLINVLRLAGALGCDPAGLIRGLRV